MGIDWSAAVAGSDPIAAELFGTNMLFDRDRVGPDGTFDDVLEALAIDHVRYPGGSVAEWYFDLTDPDASRVWAPDRNAWREVMPLSEFLGWAAREDIGVTLVIPTGSLMEGPAGDRVPSATAHADVAAYVRDVLSGRYGEARIDAFEIGNEYWLGAELNHVEYTRIASVIAEAAQSAIDAHSSLMGPEWTEPEILVQIGQYGRHSTTPGWIQNDYIRANLSDAAARAVDGVTAHYYTRGDWADIPGHAYYFDRLDNWAADPRYAGIEYHVTEWNVEMALSTELGLKQASALWMMLSEMVLRGVDAAHVWPIQQNTVNDLSGDEGQADLTIAGEAFRLMSQALPGTTLSHRSEWDWGTAWVYEGAGTSHVYIASRSGQVETFTLDRNALGLDGQLWWTTTLGSTAAPDDHHALPVLDIRADRSTEAGRVELTLDPFEVVRATFHEATVPSGPNTAFPATLGGGAHSDTIVTSDLGSRVEGRGGDDVLVGGRGGDRIGGGDGNDRLAGAGGDDVLLGGDGNDLLTGGDGADWLWGGPGHDTLEGGAGDDVYVISAETFDLAGLRAPDRDETWL